MRLPARFAPALFSLIVSGVMSCVVSAVSTMRAVGFNELFLASWPLAWLLSWAIAFSIIVFLAPRVRRFVAGLVEPPSASPQSAEPSATPGAR